MYTGRLGGWMLTLVLSMVLMQEQGVPARVVELEATVDGKPIGKVTYTRQIIPGKGMSRTIVFDVEEDDRKYTIKEIRTFRNDGTPIKTERTYTEDSQQLQVTVEYDGNVANVTYSQGGDSDTDSIALIEEGATTADPSAFWFLNATPNKNDRVVYWEYDIDEMDWVERIVTYNGQADLKVGEEIVRAHRISIGEKINVYLDDTGMPYKMTDTSVKGTMTLVRKPKADGGR